VFRIFLNDLSGKVRGSTVRRIASIRPEPEELTSRGHCRFGADDRCGIQAEIEIENRDLSELLERLSAIMKASFWASFPTQMKCARH
jgi:hypothetical protein